MEYIIRNVDNSKVVVIDLIGELDTMGVQGFKYFIFNLIEQGQVNILLNFAQVSYINSAGLGAIAMVLKKVRDNQGELKIINVSSAIMEIFVMIRFTKVIPIFDSEKGALESFLG